MNKKIVSLSVAALTLFLGACGANGGNTNGSGAESQAVTIGVVSDVEVQVWEDVKERLAEDDIELTITQFSDYNTPNTGLADGSLDLNAFQHVAFLEQFNEKSAEKITPIGFTYVSPLGLYSDTVEDYKDLPDGAEIVIPNDVTNGGRALLLLQSLELITLDEAAGTSATVSDITDNPKNLKITELDAAQTSRALGDVDAAVINTNFALDAGLNPQEDALYLDTDNIQEVSEIYKNVVAAREEDAENELYLKVVAEYQTDETAQLIEELTNGSDVSAW